MRFDYWTVQATPDATLLHTFGIGIIVADPATGQASCKFLAKELLPSIDERGEASILATTAMLKELVDEHSKFAGGISYEQQDNLRGHLSMLARDWANIITIDAPRSISANSLADATKQLFSLFIRRPAATAQHRPITVLQNAVRETYTKHARIQRAMISKAKLNTAVSTDSLDLAVADVDANVFEISTSFNFNRNDPQNLKDKIDAWNYRIQELRSNGGKLESKETTLALPSDANVVIAYINPTSKRQREVFEHAQEQWSRLGVMPLTEPQIENHATALNKQLLVG